MNTINKIVAVLNDFKTADNVLEKALKLSSQKKVTLEILYVHEEPLFDLPDYFCSNESIEDTLVDKEKIKKEIEDRVAKLESDCNCAVLVFIDDTTDRLLTLTKEDTDIFIITAYHEKITQKLIQKSYFPVLVIKNDVKDYKKIVLPVDLSKNSYECIDLAKTLFPHTDKRLLYDYRYVIDTEIIDVDYLGMPTSEPIMNTQINQELKQSQSETFEALKRETGLEGDFIEENLSIEEDLSRFINVSHFDLTILCSSDKHFLLSNSVSFSLLETLSTDVLIQLGLGLK